RQRAKAPGANAPYVSVLDTGINRAHTLLDFLIPASDNWTIDAAWSAADDDAHGTLMAGLSLYGNLTPALASRELVQIPVNLEGVKILPPPSLRATDEKLAGAYTGQGIAIAELQAAHRRRVWCVATTM